MIDATPTRGENLMGLQYTVMQSALNAERVRFFQVALNDHLP